MKRLRALVFTRHYSIYFFRAIASRYKIMIITIIVKREGLIIIYEDLIVIIKMNNLSEPQSAPATFSKDAMVW